MLISPLVKCIIGNFDWCLRLFMMVAACMSKGLWRQLNNKRRKGEKNKRFVQILHLSWLLAKSSWLLLFPSTALNWADIDHILILVTLTMWKVIFHLLLFWIFCEPVNFLTKIHIYKWGTNTLCFKDKLAFISQWRSCLLVRVCFLSNHKKSSWLCLLFQYLIFCTLCLLTILVYVDYLHDSEQYRLLLSTEPFALTV